ncbi:hypothetical protein MMC21_005552 [Puttea exsequens]|nr:hypothetical protein [Puttea exsequens]
MPSASPERGRTRSRQQDSSYAKQQTASRTRSAPRRTISPRSASRSRSPSRTPPTRGDGRNGYQRGKDRSRSPNGSNSRRRSKGRRERRDRSYIRSLSRGSPMPKSSKIVVEKLTKNVNQDHLHEIFGVYGPIRELDLPLNRQFMTNRGTAYIVYTDTPDAEAAIAHMHEAQIDGAVVNVSVVLPRRKFSRSPPPPRRGAPLYDRFEARGPPPGSYRDGPPPPSYAPRRGGGHRSPPPRRPSPPRRYRDSPPRSYGGRPDQGVDHDPTHQDQDLGLHCAGAKVTDDATVRLRLGVVGVGGDAAQVTRATQATAGAVAEAEVGMAEGDDEVSEK